MLDKHLRESVQKFVAFCLGSRLAEKKVIVGSITMKSLNGR